MQITIKIIKIEATTVLHIAMNKYNFILYIVIIISIIDSITINPIAAVPDTTISMALPIFFKRFIAKVAYFDSITKPQKEHLHHE